MKLLGTQGLSLHQALILCMCLPRRCIQESSTAAQGLQFAAGIVGTAVLLICTLNKFVGRAVGRLVQPHAGRCAVECLSEPLSGNRGKRKVFSLAGNFAFSSTELHTMRCTAFSYSKW